MDCPGCLVLHRNGDVRWCTEELYGRSCIGFNRHHTAGIMTCRILGRQPFRTRCQRCRELLTQALTIAPDFDPQQYVLPARSSPLGQFVCEGEQENCHIFRRCARHRAERLACIKGAKPFELDLPDDLEDDEIPVHKN